jgi:hypothetical protein
VTSRHSAQFAGAAGRRSLIAWNVLRNANAFDTSLEASGDRAALTAIGSTITNQSATTAHAAALLRSANLAQERINLIPE